MNLGNNVQCAQIGKISAQQIPFLANTICDLVLSPCSIGDCGKNVVIDSRLPQFLFQQVLRFLQQMPVEGHKFSDYRIFQTAVFLEKLQVLRNTSANAIALTSSGVMTLQSGPEAIPTFCLWAVLFHFWSFNPG
jgi:hypothetical protein